MATSISDAVILTVSGTDYPIRLIERFSATHFSRGMFKHMATVTASTKKAATIASSQRGTPVAHIASLKCTPLDPLDAETRNRVVTNQGEHLLMTFVDLYAIEGSDGYARLVVEELLN